jgi:hypothetical protein
MVGNEANVKQSKIISVHRLAIRSFPGSWGPNGVVRMGVAGWRFSRLKRTLIGGHCRCAGRVAVYLPRGGRSRLADHDWDHALQGLAAVRESTLHLKRRCCCERRNDAMGQKPTTDE